VALKYGGKSNDMNEYVYSPMKAAHIHRDIKVYRNEANSW